MHEKTGSDMSKVTTNEINVVELFVTGKTHKNAVFIIKSFPSVRDAGNYYEADSEDAWKYYSNKYNAFLEKKKINSWGQLVTETVQYEMSYAE